MECLTQTFLKRKRFFLNDVTLSFSILDTIEGLERKEIKSSWFLTGVPLVVDRGTVLYNEDGKKLTLVDLGTGEVKATRTFTTPFNRNKLLVFGDWLYSLESKYLSRIRKDLSGKSERSELSLEGGDVVDCVVMGGRLVSLHKKIAAWLSLKKYWVVIWDPETLTIEKKVNIPFPPGSEDRYKFLGKLDEKTLVIISQDSYLVTVDITKSEKKEFSFTGEGKSIQGHISPFETPEGAVGMTVTRVGPPVERVSIFPAGNESLVLLSTAQWKGGPVSGVERGGEVFAFFMSSKKGKKIEKSKSRPSYSHKTARAKVQVMRTYGHVLSMENRVTIMGKVNGLTAFDPRHFLAVDRTGKYQFWGFSGDKWDLLCTESVGEVVADAQLIPLTKKEEREDSIRLRKVLESMVLNVASDVLDVIAGFV